MPYCKLGFQLAFKLEIIIAVINTIIFFMSISFTVNSLLGNNWFYGCLNLETIGKIGVVMFIT